MYTVGGTPTAATHGHGGCHVVRALVVLWLARSASSLKRPFSAISEATPCDEPPPRTYRVEQLRKLPHVDKPFTQGFEFSRDGSQLIETSGSFPLGMSSYVRGVDSQTGATLWKTDAGLDGAFVEGIAQRGSEGHWFASVYKEPRVALEYDQNMEYLKKHPYHFDGWGLTRTLDDSAFYATNGSSYVMTLDPENFDLMTAGRARCLCRPVSALNELEMVEDFVGRGPALLGNVYTSRLVMALDPSTFRCIGIFNLDSVDEPFQGGGMSESEGYHVANGIAHNPKTGTYMFTGKNWESMFEARLHEDASDDSIQKLREWFDSPHVAPGILALWQRWSKAS